MIELLAHAAAVIALVLCWQYSRKFKDLQNQIILLNEKLKDLAAKSAAQNEQLQTDTLQDEKPQTTHEEKDQVEASSIEDKKEKEDEELEVQEEVKIAALTANDDDLKRVEEVPKETSEKASSASESLVAKNEKTNEPAKPEQEKIENIARVKPKKPTYNFDTSKLSAKLLEIFSTGQWAVWLGGIALLFGSIFLIKYSIEVGLLGPKIRLAMATAFALSLMGAGEYFRHKPFVIQISKIDKAYVPGILTALGSMMLYAVIYIAYYYFAFIGPEVAFTLMGIISMVTLALALLHGPSLAALGLVGSYITPLIVSGVEPNYTALFIYLLIVTCSAILLAWFRKWNWLVAASAIGSLGWAAASARWGSNILHYSFAFQFYLVALWCGYAAVATIWTWDTKGFAISSKKMFGFASNKTQPLVSQNLIFIISAIFAVLWIISIYYFKATDFSPKVVYLTMGLATLATYSLAPRFDNLLAAIGVIGSFLVPMLAGQVNYTSADLYAYLLVISIAALVLARKQNWEWLTIISSLFALIWAILATLSLHTDVSPSSGIYFLEVYLASLAVIYCINGLLWEEQPTEAASASKGSKTKTSKLDEDNIYYFIYLAIMFFALGLIANARAFSTDYLPSSVVVIGIIIASAWIVAWYRPKLFLLFPVGAITGLFAFMGLTAQELSLDIDIVSMRNWHFYFTSLWQPTSISSLLSFGFVFAMLLLCMLKILPQISESSFGKNAIFWTAPTALIAVLCYVIAWFTLGAPQYNIWILLVGLIGTGLFALSSEGIIQRAKTLSSHSMLSVLPLTVIAGAACLFAVLTIFFRFDGAYLVVLSAFLTTSLAALTLLRPVEVIRYGAVIAAAVAIVVVVVNPTLNLHPSKTIIFNSILLAYGLPALACAATSWLLAKTAPDLPQKFFEGAAVLFTALLFTLQIRHAMNGGNILSGEFKLEEQAGHTITALIMSGALMRLDEKSPSIVFRTLTLALGYVSLAMVAFSHGIALNPFFTNQSVGGGLILNTLLIAYFIPGVIAFVVHRIARNKRPVHYVTALETTSWMLLTSYVFLSIRHLYHGEFIGLEAIDFTTSEIYLETLSMLLIITLVAKTYNILFKDWRSRILPFAFGIAIATFIIFNFLEYLPLNYGVEVGSKVFFNALMLGYLLPTFALLALCYLAKSREEWNIHYIPQILGGLALISAFLWVTFSIRQLWHGSALYHFKLYSTETYTYSAMWLVLGVIILLSSEWKQSKEMKMASAIFIFAAIIKVFLFDMSALEGGLRALSFIGLGAVLIGVGLFYQKLLFSNLAKLNKQESEAKLENES